jgi:NAD(P)-dependent dehydrogenase (short-subunit alcohol dehydrogenase family)
VFAPLSLEGKVAVITGGTSGIGKALALGLADAGANVVPCSRRLDAVEQTVGEIELRRRRSLKATMDVTDRNSVTQARDAVLAAFGRVDILINCAGSIKRTPALEIPEDEWSAILDTNLTGTLRTCQLFAPAMIAQS